MMSLFQSLVHVKNYPVYDKRMSSEVYKFLSVDFQKDFTAEAGAHYKHRPSVQFIKEELVLYFRKEGILTAEIVSDYRQPRPDKKGDFCKPGSEGYASEIPQNVRHPAIWIKSANSPLWTRENAGNPDKVPGIPYEDPALFGNWLSEVIGQPGEVSVVLFGLTLDRCVLCTAQELYLRGYKVKILEEATDPYSGDPVEKSTMLRSALINNWSTPIAWKQLKATLEADQDRPR